MINETHRKVVLEATRLGMLLADGFTYGSAVFLSFILLIKF